MRKKLLITFFSVITFISVFAISASADNYGKFSVWWTKPDVVDGSLYVELLLENKSNSSDRYVEAFYGFVQAKNSSYPVELTFNISSSQITFVPVFSGSDSDFCSFSLEHFRFSTLNVPRHTVSSEDATNSYTYKYSSYKVIAFRFWGTGSIDTSSFPQGAFTVDYGGWESQKYALLNDLKSSNSSILSNLQNLYNLFLPSKGKTDNFLYTIDNKLNLIERNTNSASELLSQVKNSVSDIYTFLSEDKQKTDDAMNSFTGSGGSSVGSIASDTGNVSSSLSNSLSSGQQASDALNIFDESRGVFDFFSQSTWHNLDPSAGSNSVATYSNDSDGQEIVNYLSPYFDGFDGGS